VNEKNLRGLFEDALDGEPAHMRPIHDDVARGRALRARKMRQRAGGIGAGAAVLVAGALVVPASPLSLIDDGGPDATQPATSTVAGTPVAPEVADDPLLRSLWEAVEAELPDDVTLVEDSYVYDAGPGATGLYLSLERQERWFTLNVYLQNARPDLAEFRPCTDPHPMVDTWASAEECEEGYDAGDRWRVMSERHSPFQRLTVLEGDSAAAILILRETDLSIDEDGTILDAGGAILSAEETDALTSAASAVGERQDPADLANGIDLSGTLAAWPEMQATLEEKLDLGPLTPVPPAEGSDHEGVYDDATGTLADIDPQWQSGTIAARYVTDDGVEIDVVLWQKDRIYDTFCHDRMSSCEPLPGAGTGHDEASDALIGPGVTGSLGDRAGLYVVVGTGELVHPDDPESVALEQKVSAAQVALYRMVPFLGDDRFPVPEGI
jgi:hypothetical protein